MREFKFDEKDNYTKDEVSSLLGQHKEFVAAGYKGFVSEEDHTKVLNELKPFKTEKRTNHVKGLVSSLTDEDKIADAIALAKLTDEDDDEAIKAKVTKTIEARKYLQKAGAPVPPEAKTGTKPAPKAVVVENTRLSGL